MGTNVTPAREAPTIGSPRNSSPAPKRKGHGWVWLLLLCLAGFAGYRYFPQQTQGASKAAEKGEKAPTKRGGAVPVIAASTRRGDLGVYLTGLGSVAAYNTVLIRSRVDGELIKVAFTEGQIVHKDDLIAQIDPRPFQAQLLQAEGQLKRDEAMLENSKLDLQRYTVLSSQGVISRQQADTQGASVHQYEGAIQADKGVIENIKLQITYCDIHAPLTGRIGFRMVDQGNIVHAADANGMAAITQLQPIAVLFNLAQDYLQDVLKRVNAGQTLTVEAWDRDLKVKLGTGKLLTVDNTIDPATGTARFKAEFPNEDSSLFPNQFVNARLLVDTKRGIVIAPAAAIQRSPQGAFVYVVKQEDNTVEMRNVTPGVSEGDSVAVDSGLQSGELVVVDGVDKLQQGAKVEVRIQSKPGKK